MDVEISSKSVLACCRSQVGRGFAFSFSNRVIWSYFLKAKYIYLFVMVRMETRGSSVVKSCWWTNEDGINSWDWGKRVKHKWHNVWPHINNLGILSPWIPNTLLQTLHSITWKKEISWIQPIWNGLSATWRNILLCFSHIFLLYLKIF